MSYADDKVKYRLFLQSKEHTCKSKTNDPIWPGFKLVWYSIHVHFICKLQEDLIKTEGVMLMTKSNRLFSAISGRNSVNDPLWSGFKFIEISSMSPLSASFRQLQSKLNELSWWTNTNSVFSNQGDLALRWMIQYSQFLRGSCKKFCH